MGIEKQKCRKVGKEKRGEMRKSQGKVKGRKETGKEMESEKNLPPTKVWLLF
jgi:hypothetical protein